MISRQNKAETRQIVRQHPDDFQRLATFGSLRFFGKVESVQHRPDVVLLESMGEKPFLVDKGCSSRDGRAIRTNVVRFLERGDECFESHYEDDQFDGEVEREGWR